MARPLAPDLDTLWRYWPAAAGLAAAGLLAAAHVFQLIGYEPCTLCLRQREIYWAVLAIVAVGAFAWARAPHGRAARAVDALLAGAFLTGAAVAFFHSGVEWGWWEGPPCTGSVREFDPGALQGPMRVASCDVPPFRVLGLSMAGWNGVIALALAALSLFATLRPRDGLEAGP